MQEKVAEVNLERNMPTVEAALASLKNYMLTYRAQGYKALILIHGYGSSGVGGSIKAAVIKALTQGQLQSMVRLTAGGEQWYYRKRELTAFCKQLELYERRIANNQGVTVVILK